MTPQEREQLFNEFYENNGLPHLFTISQPEPSQRLTFSSEDDDAHPERRLDRAVPQGEMLVAVQHEGVLAVVVMAKPKEIANRVPLGRPVVVLGRQAAVVLRRGVGSAIGLHARPDADAVRRKPFHLAAEVPFALPEIVVLAKAHPLARLVRRIERLDRERLAIERMSLVIREPEVEVALERAALPDVHVRDGHESAERILLPVPVEIEVGNLEPRTPLDPEARAIEVVHPLRLVAEVARAVKDERCALAVEFDVLEPLRDNALRIVAVVGARREHDPVRPAAFRFGERGVDGRGVVACGGLQAECGRLHDGSARPARRLDGEIRTPGRLGERAKSQTGQCKQPRRFHRTII